MPERFRKHWFALLALTAIPGVCAPAVDDAGLAIYLAGRSATGRAIESRVSGDVPLTGRAAACANCHRSSGLGTAEGPARSLPITAAALFAPRTAPLPRPAYDDASLLQALTTGVSAGGRVLDPLMPRYRLDSGDGAALLRHLHGLGTVAAPGVSSEEIVLATVISDGAPTAEGQAIRRVLEKFVQIKNSGSRHESRRAAVARRHQFGERHDRAYRRWRLVVWQLHGPPATWARQLSEQYSADPPFLLLSGTAGEHWQPIHEFCESQRLPCVLPITRMVPEAAAGYYSVYLNAGSRLEGTVIARHAARTLDTERARILVVRPDSQLASAALDGLTQAWIESGSSTRAIADRVIDDTRVSARDWKQLIMDTRPTALVAWVGAPALDSLAKALRTLDSPLTIYTSEAFTRWTPHNALLDQPHLWHVLPFSFAHGDRAAFPREAEWLRAQKLHDLDTLAASQALFACHIVGEQLSALTGNFSREYFLEGLEHMLDNTNMTTLVPRTALGTGQRLVSRGAYVLPARSLVEADGAGAAWVE